MSANLEIQAQGGWPKSPIDPELTIRQQRWVEAYLETGNATEAARRAGYDASENGLRVIGCENLTKLHIRKRIEARLLEEQVTPNEVISTLASHMRADITEMFDPTGAINLEEIRERGLGHLIRKVKRKRRYEKDGDEVVPVDELEIEVNNQQTAAIQLSKILGIEQEPSPNTNEALRAGVRALLQDGHSADKDVVLRAAYILEIQISEAEAREFAERLSG